MTGRAARRTVSSPWAPQVPSSPLRATAPQLHEHRADRDRRYRRVAYADARGTNTDDNILGAQINNGSSGSVRLTKADAGTWELTNESSAYAGITRIDGGVLSVSKLSNGGVASSIGASTSAAGNLVIGNGSTLRYTGAGDATNRQFTLSQGVTFIESSGSGALQFTNTGNVTLSGAGDRTIALGGANTGLNTMGGTIADAGPNGKTTLAKNDSGTWVLTGNNTYTGNTVVNDGNLIIGNGGTTGNVGSGNVIVDSATSTLSINRSDAFDFNGTLSGPGALAQIGAGTTRLTSATNSIGATRISAGTLEIDGGLTTSAVAMTGTSTLNVDGTVQAAGGAAAALTGDAGNSTVYVSSGATLRADGTLGDGSDVLNVTGTLDTGAGVLSLGAGDDTLIVNDAVVTGAGIDAGAANSADTLQVNNALARTLTGAQFDRLRPTHQAEHRRADDERQPGVQRRHAGAGRHAGHRRDTRYSNGRPGRRHDVERRRYACKDPARRRRRSPAALASTPCS